MKLLDVKQGSDQWLKARAVHFCASDAPAMMGESIYKSRDDLLKERSTGIVPHVNEHKQALFDKGHAAEATARVIVEDRLGIDLFPIVCEEGKLLASVDGATMDYEILFEHKLWNQKLVAQVKAKELDPQYYWQLEHQLAVAKTAKKVIFCVSDGTEENMVMMDYAPVDGRREDLLAGWGLFSIDLKNYEPVAEVIPLAAKELLQLPALTINLEGKVKDSNLVVYEATALDFIQAINTDLQTDQDFADAENVVKFCDKAEKEIESSKKMALAQTASIDDLFRSMDRIKEELRTKRLKLEKLVKSRKEEVKIEITTEGRTSIRTHVEGLTVGWRLQILERIGYDFASVIKGKRNVKSIREAVNDELARSKLIANEIVENIRANEKVIEGLSEAHSLLFADINTLVFTDKSDFAETAKRRIDDHDREQKAKDEADELARTTAIKDRLTRIQGSVVDAIGATLEGAEKILVRLEVTDLDQGFDEFRDTAKDTINAAVIQVGQLISQKKEAARLAAEEADRKAQEEAEKPAVVASGYSVKEGKDNTFVNMDPATLTSEVAHPVVIIVTQQFLVELSADDCKGKDEAGIQLAAIEHIKLLQLDNEVAELDKLQSTITAVTAEPTKE